MNAHIVGSASTPFEKMPHRGFRELASSVLTDVLEDAGLELGHEIDHLFFANCAMGAWGQNNIRGQVCLTPELNNGRLPNHLPITNIEAGCATGSAVFHAAVNAVRSGDCQLALAMGVEKTWIPDDLAKTFGLFLDGIDQMHAHEWQHFFAQEGKRTGLGFKPHPHRVMFLDVHALQAKHHMKRFGSTVEEIAHIAAKNHTHGSLNPKAQLGRELSVEAILSDKEIIAPLTRAMCAPVSDGAAAVLVASDQWVAAQAERLRQRAIRVRSTVLVGGRYRDLDAPSVTAIAAEKAYKKAGVTASHIDLAEVHDATASCEMLHYESLNFCDAGAGGQYAVSGATQLGGTRPVNVSGGLVSRGHPLAATGLAMLDALTMQLRGEAGAAQVQGLPTLALAQNAGGLMGFDEALCGITILERER